MARDKETNKKNTNEKNNPEGLPENVGFIRTEPVSSEQAVDIDQKIQDLEHQLNEIKKLKEHIASDETQAKIEEKKERALIGSVNDKYAARTVIQKKDSTQEGQPSRKSDTLDMQKLIATSPKDAVARLVDMAKKDAHGFERAIDLARRVAIKPGGAWILDQFHLEMTKSKTKTA